jgi:TetR/AcrR family transcriptional regulator
MATKASVSPPREAARNARRAALLETAEQVFAERTFAGATMAEIAARAGYSAGNLYNVFENKEALFKEVMRSRGTLFMEELLGALNGGGAFSETLDRYIDAFIGSVERQHNFFVILSQPTGIFEWGTGVSSKDAETIRSTIQTAVLRLFEKAVASGEIPGIEPMVYATGLNGMLNAYAADWVRNDGKPEDLWARLDQLRTVIHRAVGVTP